MTSYISKTARRNRDRIEEDEAELKKLMEPQEDKKEETVQEEPKISREEESFKKRYGDLRRHLQEKENEWKEKFESLEAKLKGSTVAPPASDEDVDAWVAKHPDVAAIVKMLAAREAQAKFEKADLKLKEYDTVTKETVRAKAEQEIRKAHPDFDDLKEADDFHDWAEEQPKWVQDAIYENADDPRSVIRVFDLYKADKGLTKKDAKRSEREAVTQIKTNSRTAIDAEEEGSYFKESDVQRMSDKEYEKNEEKIYEAMRKNKFIYDVTGSAR